MAKLRVGTLEPAHTGCDLNLRAFGCSYPECPVLMRAPPKGERDRHRIDVETAPPCRFVTVPVEFAMVQAANRYGEFVADFASQGTRLRIAEMVRIGWLAAAHEARLLGYKLEVVLVAQPEGLARRAGGVGGCFIGGGH